MTRSYQKRTGPRVPPAVEQVQVNACYTPTCPTFAVWPSEDAKRWGPRQDADAYVLGSKGQRGGATSVAMICRGCGMTMRMLSNAACVEEHQRLTRPVFPALCCPNASCMNHTRPVDGSVGEYQRFGVTSAGSARYRCRRCQRTLSASSSASHRLRRADKTEEVLRLLVNKMPMRRLCEAAGIRPTLLYQRIGLLHGRLAAFAQQREASFVATHTRERLRVAIDRQDHPLAWGAAVERQAFVLRSAACADTDSGYVLAQHVNYDPDENAMRRELEARACGDPDQPAAFRKFARLWLPYEAAPERSDDAAALADGQHAAADSTTLALAGRGAFVHENYTLAAHVLALRPWFDTARHVHVSMDKEPSLDRALLLSYAQRVREGTLDAFWVRINKGLSVAKRRLAVARLETWLAKRTEESPDLSEAQLLLQVLEERLASARTHISDPRKRWIMHPYASLQEPDREVLCLTDTPERSTRRIVGGLSRATLRAVDRYFMQVRRKLSVLERPIKTSSTLRVWYGYNAYSPRVVVQLLEIFRVVYNFHLVGQDRLTPAQRLGVAGQRYSLAELIAEPINRPIRAGSKVSARPDPSAPTSATEG